MASPRPGCSVKATLAQPPTDVRGSDARLLGDLIAHNFPLSSFSNILSVFHALLGEDMMSMISTAVRKPIFGLPKETPALIVSDVKLLGRGLVRLFQIRNILCHEFPWNEVWQPDGPLIQLLKTR